MSESQIRHPISVGIPAIIGGLGNGQSRRSLEMYDRDESEVEARSTGGTRPKLMREP